MRLKGGVDCPNDIAYRTSPLQSGLIQTSSVTQRRGSCPGAESFLCRAISRFICLFLLQQYIFYMPAHIRVHPHTPQTARCLFAISRRRGLVVSWPRDNVIIQCWQ